MKAKMFTNGHSDLNVTDMHVGILNTLIGTGAIEGEGYCSHLSMLPDDEYSSEVFVDLSKARRQVEDRLRKDGQMLKKVLFFMAWADDHHGIKDGFLESQIEKI